MSERVDVVAAEPRTLAAVRVHTTSTGLSKVIRPAFDLVYAAFGGFSRERMGHNVILYPDGCALATPRGADVFCGVEMKIPFEDRGEIVHASTPAGRAAHVTHWGDYAKLAEAYGALRRHCAARGLVLTGANWEVYGDWYDDPEKVRTDVFCLLTSSSVVPPSAG